MPLITETYYLSLTQDNRGILRLRCSQDDTLRTVNLKLYNNGSIFTIPSGVSASISGVKQNGVVFSKPCTISQDRESVVLQLSSDITNTDGIIVAEIVLNDGEGGRLGTSNFIIQIEKNPIRAGVVQDTETPIEYISDFIDKIQTLTARLNNLITPSGDASLEEVVDARIGILDSTTYQTLGARLNAEFQRLSNALSGITILESTGDATDRTSEILSKLNAYGTCKLGKGDFYVSGLVMPEGSHLVGSGSSTRVILPSGVTNGYIVKPRSNCIVGNISFYGGFTGTYSELIASGADAKKHCIILDRFDSVNSENVILSNIFINNFVGSAIIQRYTVGCHCKDIVINMCYAGIDISNASYDGLCTNVYISGTRFGVVQNGNNFVFSGCISKDSEYHIMSDQQNTECTFSSCTFFDSSLETTAKLASLSNARNGFVFDNCMFDSSLSMLLNACDGIVIKGTNFVGSDTFAITVSNGRNTLLLITDCIADVEPTVTNAGTATRITSCYLKDGTAWTISEADIIVDDELSDESENPVQNKVINRAIGEIKADLDVSINLSEIVFPFEITATNKSVNSQNGTLQTAGGYGVTEYVDVHGYSTITYKRVGLAASTVPMQGMAFFSENKTYISGVSSANNQAEANYVDHTVDVPENAYYARFTTRLDTETYGEFSVSTNDYALKSQISSISNNIANAESEIENIINISDVSIPFTLGATNRALFHHNGEMYSSSGFTVTGYVDIHSYSQITYKCVKVVQSVTSHGMAFYDSNKVYISGVATETGASEPGYMDKTIDVPNGAYYARFTTRSDTTTYGEFALWSGSEFKRNLSRFIISETDGLIPQNSEDEDENNFAWSLNINALPQKTNGVYSVASRMRMLTDIKWTPLKPVPNQVRSGDNLTYGTFPAEKEVTGIPYAAQLTYELWVGKAVSFETFLSALANPNSVIYSSGRVGAQYRGSAWYSINCSKAVGWALGLRETYATGAFSSNSNISKIKNAGAYTADDIQVGDILENPSYHTAIVTDVLRNSFGDISKIEVSEAVTPVCRRKKWSVSGYKDNFFTQFSGYNLLRYSLIDDVLPIDMESMCPYISKTLGLNHGNRSNYLTSDTVKITLLNKLSDTLKVKKNGNDMSDVDISGYETGDEITFATDGAGFYEINYSTGNSADSVEFCKVGDTASISNNVLTFGSTTGILKSVGYAGGDSRSHLSDAFPTAEDLANGYMNLNPPTGTTYIHVHFGNDYGVSMIEIPTS